MITPALVEFDRVFGDKFLSHRFVHAPVQNTIDSIFEQICLTWDRHFHLFFSVRVGYWSITEADHIAVIYRWSLTQHSSLINHLKLMQRVGRVGLLRLVELSPFLWTSARLWISLKLRVGLLARWHGWFYRARWYVSVEDCTTVFCVVCSNREPEGHGLFHWTFWSLARVDDVAVDVHAEVQLLFVEVARGQIKEGLPEGVNDL